jgi:hypothetical protein
MKVLIQAISSIIAMHRTMVFNYSFTANTIDVSYWQKNPASAQSRVDRYLTNYFLYRQCYQIRENKDVKKKRRNLTVLNPRL